MEDDYEDDEYVDETEDAEEAPEPVEPPAAAAPPPEEDDWTPYQPEQLAAPEPEPEPAPKPVQYAAADTGTRTDASPAVEDDWTPYVPPTALSASTGASGASGDDWTPYEEPNPADAKRGFGERIAAGWEGGFGTHSLGLSPETQQKFPMWQGFQPLVAGADAVMRSVPGAVGAVMGGVAAAAEKDAPGYPGLSRTQADRMQRDLKIGGDALLAESGIGMMGARAQAHTQQGWAKGAQRLPEPPPPHDMPGVRNQDWTGPPKENVPPPLPPDQPALPLGPRATPYPYDVRTGEAALSRGEIQRKAQLAENWENLTPQEKAEFNTLHARDPSAAVKTEAPRPQIGGGEAQPSLFPDEPAKAVVSPQESARYQELSGRLGRLTPAEQAEYSTLSDRYRNAPVPERPGPSVQPGLPLEPPVEAPPLPGQKGANITAPDIHSRPAGPPTAGVAKEATPPTTGVDAPNYPRYNKWPAVGEAAPPREPGAAPHSAVTEGQAANGPPGAAKGINVLQPGQADPTLQFGLFDQTNQPPKAPVQKTFEAPKPPDGTYPPPAQPPIPKNMSLVPSPQTTQGVTEPPVAGGHTRMYKGDPRSPTDFTTDRKIAESYGQPVRHVDVPNAQVAAQFQQRAPGEFTANKLWESPTYQKRLQATGEVKTPETKPQAPLQQPPSAAPPPEPPPAQGGPKPAGGSPTAGTQVAPPGAAPPMTKAQVAELKAAEATLAKEEKIYKTMVDAGAAPQGIAIAKARYELARARVADLRGEAPPAPAPPYVKPAPPAPPPPPVSGKGAKIPVTYSKHGKLKVLQTEGKPTTVAEALKAHGTQPGLISELTAHMSDVVKAQIGKMPVHFATQANMDKIQHGNAKGFYSPTHHLIVLNLDYMKDAQHVVMHEAIHGITSNAMHSDKQVAYMMRTIKEEVQKQLGKYVSETLQNGFKNEREFVAEAFSKTTFQDMLKRIELPPEVTKKLNAFLGTQPKTAWDAIVDTVRKIIGLPESKMTALEAVMRTTEHIVSKNEAATKDLMTKIGKDKHVSYGIDPMAADKKPSVIARDKFGNEVRFTGETVHAAAARAMKNKYSTILNEDGTPYTPPKNPAQTTAQTPANTAQMSAKTAQPPKTAQTAQKTAQTAAPAKPTLSLPQRAINKLPEGQYRDAANAAATKLMDIGHELQMKAAPMARGTEQAMALAKDFANSLRVARQEWAWADAELEKFTPERRRAMWDAADAESVAQQTGKPTKNGLASLRPEEREVIQNIQARSSAAWDEAIALGMVAGKGLPSYTPRIIVDIIGGGVRGPSTLDAIGKNLSTKTAQMKHRTHLTAVETEAAAKAKLGPDAKILRDIRTLPYATGKLEDAIAGRRLVDGIREAGRNVGEATVMEGGKPKDSPHKWFTIDHPSLKVWRATEDSAGNTSFREVPLYIRGDFEGPLRAVLSTENSKIYNGAMDLKGKVMSVVMTSPVIHNAVEFGRAVPAAPGKVLTGRVYFQGNAVKKNKPLMREAIGNGLVPIGGRGYMADINSIMEAPNMKAGRSWTAQVSGFLAGKIKPEWGEATKRGIDKAGNFWHNTLLWDRVGDLQVGLYKHFMDDLIADGFDRQSASRAAAHLANRYAGALPQEAMSSMAQKTANMTMFSRSFTLGNLGVMKDMVNGLPRDVRAQIARDVGALNPKGEAAIKSMARRKAISIVAIDIVLGTYVANSFLQSMSNIIRGEKTGSEELKGYADRTHKLMEDVSNDPMKLLQPFHLLEKISATDENEPTKKERILSGYTADGQAIYARNPVGKIGEEFIGWASSPLDMLKRKGSTYARPLLQLASNDKGFGQKIYDPKADTVSGHVQNLVNVLKHFITAQTPEGQIEGAKNLIKGDGDQNLNALQTFGPMTGVTFSRGAPGGPAEGERFYAREQNQYKVQQAMPEIRKMIKRGDIDGAVSKMDELKIAPALQRYYIRTTENPSSRLTPKAMRDFERSATPEQRERMMRQLERTR